MLLGIDYHTWYQVTGMLFCLAVLVTIVDAIMSACNDTDEQFSHYQQDGVWISRETGQKAVEPLWKEESAYERSMLLLREADKQAGRGNMDPQEEYGTPAPEGGSSLQSLHHRPQGDEAWLDSMPSSASGKSQLATPTSQVVPSLPSLAKK